MAMWSEQLHPRNSKGPGGGEFKSANAAATSKTANPRTAKAPRGGGGSMSFNGKTGTGYGMKHGDPRVRKLQQALNKLGLKDAKGRPLKIDGKLGPLTTQAIKAWQRKNGMKPTGAISAADIKRMTAGGGHRKAHLLKGSTRTRATAFTARRTSLTARAK